MGRYAAFVAITLLHLTALLLCFWRFCKLLQSLLRLLVSAHEPREQLISKSLCDCMKQCIQLIHRHEEKNCLFPSPSSTLQTYAAACPVSPVLLLYEFPPLLSESITLQHLLSAVTFLTLTSCLPCSQKNSPGRWNLCVWDPSWSIPTPFPFTAQLFSIILQLLTRLRGHMLLYSDVHYRDAVL